MCTMYVYIVQCVPVYRRMYTCIQCMWIYIQCMCTCVKCIYIQCMLYTSTCVQHVQCMNKCVPNIFSNTENTSVYWSSLNVKKVLHRLFLPCLLCYTIYTLTIDCLGSTTMTTIDGYQYQKWQYFASTHDAWPAVFDVIHYAAFICKYRPNTLFTRCSLFQHLNFPKYIQKNIYRNHVPNDTVLVYCKFINVRGD